MNRIHLIALLLSLCAVQMPEPTWAQTAETEAAGLFERCDGDTAARIRFLEQSLDDNSTYAQYYFGGWLGFYTIGLGVSSYNAANNERGERAVQIASAVKAVGGIGRILFWQPSARFGADSSRSMPVNNQADCSLRLQKAEEQLRTNAHESDRRWGWKAHVFNAALHVTGAVIVGEVWGARKDAWAQAGLGTVIGEAVIWTHPWQANDTIEEYERRFPASGLPPEPRVSWGLAPTLGGAGLYVRF
jgi:hypothetical protein